MKKLSDTYEEKIGNKERNKIKIYERVEMMKEEKRRNNYFYSFATVLGLIVILVGGYFHFNQADTFKENENNDHNLKEIIIEGTTYYNYYEMGVNMEKVPESNIYGYAIRQDENSYKIVSLHQDGTNFDLVAVDEPLEVLSNDGSNLTEHYKLVLVDNKLYFIRSAYNNLNTSDGVNQNIVEGKNQKYDLEVYYVDITEEHPKLELLLQKGAKETIYYDVSGVMIHNGNLYYHNSYDSNLGIEVLSLSNEELSSNIKLPEKIFSYHINNNNLYVSFGTDDFDENNIYYQEAKYAIIDLIEKDENGYNLIKENITKEEFYDTQSILDIWTSNELVHYYDYNRYTTLWADNKLVMLEGYESSEKGVGFIGYSLIIGGDKEAYRYNSTDTKGLTLLNTNGSLVNFCIGEGPNCEEYYSFDITTGETKTSLKEKNYFILIDVPKL